MSSQRGEVSMISLLIAMVLGGLVSTATLATYATFSRTAEADAQHNIAQDRVRTASDVLARALRNLASPNLDQPQAIDRATTEDLIVQSVDPAGPNAGANLSNVRRQRFCLDGGHSIWQQVQTWTTASPPAAPAATACPGAGWASSTVLADGIVNHDEGVAVFAYDSATLTEITSIGVDLRVQAGQDGPPVALRTGVFLRNQNRRPVASFTATATSKGIVLNGSASYDPEGQPLDFTWYDASTAVGTGITLTYPVTAGTSHLLHLVVSDPAGLQTTTANQTVAG